MHHHRGCYATIELVRVRAENDELMRQCSRLRRRISTIQDDQERALESSSRRLRASWCNQLQRVVNQCLEHSRSVEEYMEIIGHQRDYWKSVAAHERSQTSVLSGALDTHLLQKRVSRMLTHMLVKPNPTCAICRTSQPRVRSLVVLGCSHWFCSGCWGGWKRARRQHRQEPNCPVCRTGLSATPGELAFSRVQTPSPRGRRLG
jgi:hypothetical protein